MLHAQQTFVHLSIILSWERLSLKRTKNWSLERQIHLKLLKLWGSEHPQCINPRAPPFCGWRVDKPPKAQKERIEVHLCTATSFRYARRSLTTSGSSVVVLRLLCALFSVRRPPKGPYFSMCLLYWSMWRADRAIQITIAIPACSGVTSFTSSNTMSSSATLNQSSIRISTLIPIQVYESVNDAEIPQSRSQYVFLHWARRLRSSLQTPDERGAGQPRAETARQWLLYP